MHAISSHLQVFLSSASVTLCAHTRQLVVQSTIPLCVLSSVYRVSRTTAASLRPGVWPLHISQLFFTVAPSHRSRCVLRIHFTLTSTVKCCEHSFAICCLGRVRPPVEVNRSKMPRIVLHHRPFSLERLRTELECEGACDRFAANLAVESVKLRAVSHQPRTVARESALLFSSLTISVFQSICSQHCRASIFR